MQRFLSWLPLWLACLTSTTLAAPASVAAVTITFSEQPVQLVRDTSIYHAERGTALQPGDMLETGKGSIQLGVGLGTVGIGPASRLYVRSAAELVLLDGWLKVHAPAGARIGIASAGLQFVADNASATLHASGGTAELFAESGTLSVRELDGGKAAQRKAIPAEQFAIRSGAQPLRLVPRPTAAFLAAMPETFRDTLVPVAAPSAPVAPKRERAARFAELSGWLDREPALRQQVERRFAPPPRPRHPPSPSPVQ